jgi:sugar/nucleoside kinase (ribokinase family)
MSDVFCYGAISLDVSGRLERPLKMYEQATAIDYRTSPGGDATLVALTLSGLGMDVTLAGSPIGDDPIGEYLLKMLGKGGVRVIVPKIGKTAVTAIVLDKDRRSTITFHDNTPEEEIPIPHDALMGSKYAYVDGCFGRNGAIIAKRARAIGIRTLLNLDIPSVPNVSLFDTVIANEGASKLISPEPAEAARKLHETNNGLAIITLGEKGCICCNDRGRLMEISPYCVEAVDTTGAGAAFAAGFIYASLEGEPLEACLDFASAVGAYKTIHRGSYIKFSKNDIIGFAKGRKK